MDESVYPIKFNDKIIISIADGIADYSILDSPLISVLSQARLQTQSYPECDEGCESDGGEEVSGEFVVAGRDAAEVLDATEGVFDQVAVSVSPRVIGDGALSVAASRNDGHDRDAAQHLAQRIGVISLVGEDVAGSGQICEQNRCGLHVGDIARGQVKSKGSPQNVCQSVDFAGLAAARWTDALRFRPPFPP